MDYLRGVIESRYSRTTDTVSLTIIGYTGIVEFTLTAKGNDRLWFAASTQEAIGSAVLRAVKEERD